MGHVASETIVSLGVLSKESHAKSQTTNDFGLFQYQLCCETPTSFPKISHGIRALASLAHTLNRGILQLATRLAASAAGLWIRGRICAPFFGQKQTCSTRISTNRHACNLPNISKYHLAIQIDCDIISQAMRVYYCQQFTNREQSEQSHSFWPVLLGTLLQHRRDWLSPVAATWQNKWPGVWDQESYTEYQCCWSYDTQVSLPKEISNGEHLQLSCTVILKCWGSLQETNKFTHQFFQKTCCCWPASVLPWGDFTILVSLYERWWPQCTYMSMQHGKVRYQENYLQSKIRIFVDVLEPHF